MQLCPACAVLRTSNTATLADVSVAQWNEQRNCERNLIAVCSRCVCIFVRARFTDAGNGSVPITWAAASDGHQSLFELTFLKEK